MRVASQLLLLAVVAGQRVLELHDAINDKDLETTRELLDEGYDINEKPPEGVLKQSTPLMYAVRSGFKEGVKLLLKRGADWTIADETGYTPIDACAFHGHFAIMKVLIDHGIPFNEYAWDGFAPLHRACVGTEKAHVYTVEILLKAGADPKLPAKPAPPKQKKKPKKKRKGGQKSVWETIRSIADFDASGQPIYKEQDEEESQQKQMLINPIAMAKREDTKELIQEFLLKAHRKKNPTDQRSKDEIEHWEL